MRNKQTSLWVDHTSISCILEQYFDFWGNLNFHDFSRKSAFLADFELFSAKIAKKFTTVTFFMKIRLDLINVRITTKCSNMVVQRFRDTLRVPLSALGAQVVFKTMPSEMRAFEGQKGRKSYYFTSKYVFFGKIPPSVTEIVF